MSQLRQLDRQRERLALELASFFDVMDPTATAGKNAERANEVIGAIVEWGTAGAPFPGSDQKEVKRQAVESVAARVVEECARAVEDLGRHGYDWLVDLNQPRRTAENTVIQAAIAIRKVAERRT